MRRNRTVEDKVSLSDARWFRCEAERVGGGQLPAQALVSDGRALVRHAPTRRRAAITPDSRSMPLARHGPSTAIPETPFKAPSPVLRGRVD